jgi:hypothetical protein
MLPATRTVVSTEQWVKKTRVLRMTVYGRTLTVIVPAAVVGIQPEAEHKN